MQIKDKELVEIKEQVSIVQEKIIGLEIKNNVDMSKATDILHNIRQAEKYVDERKTNITRPIMSSLSQIRDLFAPIETSLKNANKEVKQKMLSWQILEDERIEKEINRIATRVERGTMKNTTAVDKLSALGEVSAGSQGEVGKSSIREVKKVRVVDEFAVPREYLVLNMPMITEAVIRKGLTIPGVESFLEKSIVSR